MKTAFSREDRSGSGIQLLSKAVRKLAASSWRSPLLLVTLLCVDPARGVEAPGCEIQVVDAATGRGVPLVELETVDRVRFVTDNAGRVAFFEPGLMDQEVFFSVRSHGYEFPKDGFGMAGTRVKTVPGSKTVVKIRRMNIAERLYRITGAGLYRDSILLGYDAPLAKPLLNALILGQDSTQVALYRGRPYWFWGDTQQLKYPLGNFRTTGAVSDLPGKGGLDPDVGVDLTYFQRADGFSKELCPFEPKDGLIWIDGVMSVRVNAAEEKLLCHYARLKGLGEVLEHGLALFNDERSEFEKLAAFKMEEQWQCPRGPVVAALEGDVRYFYFCTPFPTVRVRATLGAITNSAAYEAYTCLADGSSTDPKTARLQRGDGGELNYRWTRSAPPMGSQEEAQFIKAGLMELEEGRFTPRDVESQKAVLMHGGSVRWNVWRGCWVLIAVEQGGRSFLGEVWYSEARALTGPWAQARRIVTHQQYTFYNPIHHAFFDREGGRTIYFEGTYSREFSGNPEPTPRYDYNQVMYRLDLADPRLESVRAAKDNGESKR